MVRASKKDENGGKAQDNPELEERKRLKKLSFSKNLLSQTPARPISPLSPSKIVRKHHGRDIGKKSQRRNRFLFSFPGLLAPITGGKIGELKDLGTKNPILYLDFPQGQLKLFGTIVYPKNRYLTLQFSKGGKTVTCEDYFDNMIVFSEAWWIGSKDENPEEIQLDFPKELKEGQHVNADYDFKGGAGVTSEEKPGASNPGKEYVDVKSPRTDSEDDISRDSDPITGDDLNDMMNVTPVRQSARTAGKKFNFADASSGDDSEGSPDMDADIPEIKEKASSEDLDDADKIEGFSLSVKKSKELPLSKRGPLVQTTISSMFEKMEEKVCFRVCQTCGPMGGCMGASSAHTGGGTQSFRTHTSLGVSCARLKSRRSSRTSPKPKVSGRKLVQTDLKQKAAQKEDVKPRKKGSMIKERKAGAGIGSVTKQEQSETSVQIPKVYRRKKTKCTPTPLTAAHLDGPSSSAPASNPSMINSLMVEDDEIEELSSESEDIDGSDDDWAA
ncbi:DNA-binding protein RHL1 isoform X1 [Macadamia integrifolia]|uniref:DNA-binding protein RHL1 isoform X1 n=1 Tax=Macadamia integrifolia TaxID=60698 RepID=UPI001C4F541F|nr:DNA-binding protein RHL1 isoform X1 [Macadamia integrifolia]